MNILGQRFSWDKNTGTAFASDLNGFEGQESIVVKSHRTGAELRFYNISTEYGLESEVEMWIYTAKMGHDREIILKIFND